MNVTPEIVRAEMDYRVERALASARRASTGRTSRTMLSRLRERLEATRPAVVNGAPRAA